MHTNIFDHQHEFPLPNEPAFVNSVFPNYPNYRDKMNFPVLFLLPPSYPTPLLQSPDTRSLRFSQQCWWRLKSSGIRMCVAPWIFKTFKRNLMPPSSWCVQSTSNCRLWYSKWKETSGIGLIDSKQSVGASFASIFCVEFPCQIFRTHLQYYRVLQRILPQHF